MPSSKVSDIVKLLEEYTGKDDPEFIQSLLYLCYNWYSIDNQGKALFYEQFVATVGKNYPCVEFDRKSNSCKTTGVSHEVKELVESTFESYSSLDVLRREIDLCPAWEQAKQQLIDANKKLAAQEKPLLKSFRVDYELMTTSFLNRICSGH